MSIRRNRQSTLRRRVATLAAAGIVATTGGLFAAATPASAATVSDTTIAAAAKRAGLSGCRGISTATWVAIALAESGGRTTAHATGIEDSRGLWQINRWAHGSWVGGRNLYDVNTNAWAAKKVCEMQGPKAWSVYSNGRYKAYLSRGQAAAARV
ncbi:MAG: transglycosylase [Frankia sp.]|nr:transglycosylase [Frankia sp.]